MTNLLSLLIDGIRYDLAELRDIARYGWSARAGGRTATGAIEGGRIGVPSSELIDAAVEIWRLKIWLESKDGPKSAAAAKYSLRKLAEFSAKRGIETLDLTGQDYDPGLQVEVVDRIASNGATGRDVISEMVAPVCTFNGKVVRYGKVVVTLV